MFASAATKKQAKWLGASLCRKASSIAIRLSRKAGKNGFSEKSGDIRMSLDDQQRGLRESFCWTIADEDGKLFINAESGTLLGKM